MRIGLDLVEIKRLENKPEHFLERVFTPAERAYADGRAQTLAGMYAAKEAAAKALVTGLSGFALTDVEVQHDDLGAPRLRLYRAAAALAGTDTASVSISHDGGIAAAIVWIE